MRTVASSLGAAAVEIIAETDQFDEEIRRNVGRIADETAARFSRSLRRIQGDVEETGRRLSSALGDGAEDASRSIQRMTQLAGEADQALRDLDPAELDRISRQAGQSADQLEAMARAAAAGQGEFSGLDAGQIRTITRQAQLGAEQMRRLAERTHEAGRNVEDFSDPVSIRRLAEELRQAQREAQRLDRTGLQNFRRDVGATTRALLTGFRGGAEGARDALDDIDNADFRRLVLKAVLAANGVRNAFKRATKDVDFRDVGSRLTGFARTVVGAGAVVGVLASKLAGLVAVGTQVGAALAPSAEIIAGLPAALTLAVAAIATLKIGLSGVGEAFKAAVGGDQKAFEESIKNLAPSARAVAKEVNALAPVFKRLKQSVQGALFAPLQGEITAVVKNLAGPLRTGMTATAAEFGRLASGVTAFGRSASAVALVRDTFSRLRAEVAGVKTTTITGLFTAFQRFVSQTLPGFGGLGSFIDRALQKLTAFLNKAVDGGKAFSWLQTGKAAIGQLVGILQDVGATAKNVFTAIRDAGGGSLENISKLAQGLRDFSSSAQGQTALVQVFSAINAVAAQTLPVIKALIGGLGTLAPTIQQLALQVGPILVDAISGLVPALEGLGQGLIPVFQALGDGVSQLASGGQVGELGVQLGKLLASLAPLLPAIASLINSGLRVLNPALSVLIPVIGAVVSAIAALAQSPLGAVFGPFVAQFGIVLALTGKVGLAFRSLGPTLRLTGTLLRLAAQAVLFLGRALITALIANPIAAAIIAVISVLVILYFKVEAVRNVVNAIGRALAAAGIAIFNFGKSLVEAFQAGGVSGLISKLGSSLSNLGGIIGGALGSLGSTVLSALTSGFTSVLSFLASLPGRALQALINFGPTILKAFTTGVAQVLGFLVSLPARLFALFLQVVAQIGIALLQVGPIVLRAFVTGLGNVILFVLSWQLKILLFFLTLPLRILSALLSLALFLKKPFLDGLNAVTSFLSTAIPAVINFFLTLPDRIGAFMDRIPGILSRAWASAKAATIAGVVAIIVFSVSLPGKIKAGLSRLGSILSNLASNAWNTFKTATARGITTAITTIKALPGKVLSALDTFNQKMAQLGRDIIQGFINGVKSLISQAVSSVTGPLGDIAGKVKALVGSNSPSKVFHRIGGDVMQGFINGSDAKSKKAFEVFRKLIAKVIDITGRGFVTSLTGTTAKINATFDKLIKAVAVAFKGKNSRIDDILIKGLEATNKRLTSLAKDRDKIANTIKAATEKAAEVTAAARQFASLASVGQDLGQIPADQLPRTEAQIKKAAALAQAAADAQARQNDPRLLVQGLAQRLKVIQKFNADVEALAKRGLNKDLIAQVIGLGPDQGAGLAAGLANATADQIADLNRTQASILKATKTLGNDSADILFDSGKQAGKGFLEGLKSQQAEIIKLMTALAKGVANTVKKTLKISSPSRVFAGLGSDTLEGFVSGIEQIAPQVEAALQRAVNARGLQLPDLSASAAEQAIRADRFAAAVARTPATTPASSATSPAARASSAASQSSANTRAGSVQTINVNAPVTVTMPNADPLATGRAVSEAIADRVNR